MDDDGLQLNLNFQDGRQQQPKRAALPVATEADKKLGSAVKPAKRPRQNPADLAAAADGSGKTLAYLAPIIQQLQAAVPRITRAQGSHAIILVPTRELAVQVI
eukprot:gene12966-13095_t